MAKSEWEIKYDYVLREQFELSTIAVERCEEEIMEAHRVTPENARILGQEYVQYKLACLKARQALEVSRNYSSEIAMLEECVRSANEGDLSKVRGELHRSSIELVSKYPENKSKVALAVQIEKIAYSVPFEGGPVIVDPVYTDREVLFRYDQRKRLANWQN